MITKSDFGLFARMRFWLGGARWKWLPCRECGLELAFITELKAERATHAPPPLPSKRQILDDRERIQEQVRTHDWENGKFKPLHLLCPCCRTSTRVTKPSYAINPICLLCRWHYDAEIKATLLRLSPESRVDEAWAALAAE